MLALSPILVLAANATMMMSGTAIGMIYQSAGWRLRARRVAGRRSALRFGLLSCRQRSPPTAPGRLEAISRRPFRIARRPSALFTLGGLAIVAQLDDVPRQMAPQRSNDKSTNQRAQWRAVAVPNWPRCTRCSVGNALASRRAAA